MSYNIPMKYFDWDNKKNNKLKTRRNICFEGILIAIEEGMILDIVVHKIEKSILIKNILKKIIPSRQATKKY